MRKPILVAFLSLLLLNACSSPEKYTSIDEAFKSEGIQLTPIDSPDNTELNGIKPRSYKLGNNEIITIYTCDSEETRKLANDKFQEQQQLVSAHAPIVYQPSNHFVLYYSHAESVTRTPKLSETEYGEKLEKALTSLE